LVAQVNDKQSMYLPLEIKNLPPKKLQTDSEAHNSSYTMGAGVSAECKAAAAWSYSSPSVAEVKNEWSYTFTPLHAFIAWSVITLYLPFMYKQSTEKCTINTVSVW